MAQGLIENQARIVKSCVKTWNFDHWCIEASELVDLVIDLAQRNKNIFIKMDCQPETKVSVEFQI